ncbi:MAG: alanine racemase [Clostridiales bacterium]|nr:alanine racemase [Clostridiales bacterium]
MSRPVWVEINLDYLAHNMQEVKKLVKDEALITAVIKADGYGHGAGIIGKILLENGADRFAVATFNEALELRAIYPDIPILVLGYTLEEDFIKAEEKHIILTVYTFEQAEYIVKNQLDIKIHLKIDTGMGRLGFRFEDENIEKTVVLKGLDIEGIYTHFAKADELDKTFTHMQVERFEAVLKRIRDLGVDIPIEHVSNSAGIIDFPEYRYDMVRAGIMLYGLYPSDDVDHKNVELKQVMSLKARAALVKEIKIGEGISYGLIYKADKKKKVVTLPLGYADGWTRLLSGKAMVFYNGVRKPILGRICMDQCVMDGDGIDIKKGDIVELFGENISIDEVANNIGTINYEITCMMGKRIPRVYTKNGKKIEYIDYIEKLTV